VFYYFFENDKYEMKRLKCKKNNDNKEIHCVNLNKKVPKKKIESDNVEVFFGLFHLVCHLFKSDKK
jgi:hypothetical protein